MSEQTGVATPEKPGRYQRSTAGLFGALSLIVVLVALVVGFRLLTTDEPVLVQPVDYEQDARFASEAATFDLVIPESLPEGWRATTVRFTPGNPQHWHLGLLTDADSYVGLEQGEESTASMIETYVDEQAVEGEPVDVAGTPWSTYSDEGGDLALVRREGDTTTLVVGHDVDEQELTAFAASLEPPR